MKKVMIQGSVGQFDESEPKRKEKKQKKGAADSKITLHSTDFIMRSPLLISDG